MNKFFLFVTTKDIETFIKMLKFHKYFYGFDLPCVSIESKTKINPRMAKSRAGKLTIFQKHAIYTIPGPLPPGSLISFFS